MNERLLIVEDEETLCESLKRVLTKEGYAVDTVSSAEAALEEFEKGVYDLVITDIILPGITGIELLKRIKEKLPEQTVVIMTAYASLETAVEALRTGAYDYIVKPVMHEEIKQIVKHALKQCSLLQENVLLKEDIRPLAEFFVRKYSAELGKIIKGIDPGALDLLEGYHWPGSVRELRNIIERAVLISEGDVITVKHLPPLS